LAIGDLSTGPLGAALTTDKLAPGHYVAVCNLPGHYHNGMRVDFTVG
jgi:uncharacterized cupredoxin-like copper-binding protein